MKHNYLLFVSLLFILSNFLSLSFATEIKPLGTERGLMRGYVNDIETDSLGYAWIATANGISRYSGYELKSYTLSQYIQHANKNIVEIINHKGDLYIIGKRGYILKYRYEQDDFEMLGELSNKIFNSAYIEDEKLFIGLKRGLLIFDLNNNTFGDISIPKAKYNRKVYTHNGQLYSATSSGLLQLSYEGGKLKMVKKILKGMDILDFTIDNKSRLWVGTEGNGLLLIDNNQIEDITPAQIKEKKYAVRRIAFDKTGNAIIAVDRLGLFLLNKQYKVTDIYAHNPDNHNSIRQNSVHEIYIDNKQRYWLGIGEVGIDIIDTEINPFTNIYHTQNEPNSLGHNTVRSIYKDTKGNIWYGTESGVYKQDRKGNWTDFSQLEALKNTPVLTINEYEGNLLLGTYGEGVLVLDPSTRKITKPYVFQGKAMKLVFTSMVLGNELWVGGNGAPLSCFIDGKFTKRYTIGRVKQIIRGKDDKILIGSKEGIFEVSSKNDIVKKMFASEENIHLNGAYSLLLDHKKELLWIGNEDGLHQYNYKTEKLSSIEASMDIGIVYSLASDKSGNIWMGTSSGMFKFDPSKKLFRKFTQEDGVYSDEFGFGALARFKDGSIVFGGPKGAVIFNPEQIKPHKEVSNIFVSNFLVNGVDAQKAHISSDINFLNKINLAHDQNSLSFTFETLQLDGNKHNKFIWQLKGYDETPVESTSKRIAEYSKLPSGEYELQVQMFNADGIPSPDTYKLSINIKNPFWLSWWAIIIYIIILVTIVVLRVQVGKSRELQRFSEEKIKFFVNVAHDIRTPVSLIQLSSEQLLNNENTENSIRLIRRNTQYLNDYVTQLLDFQKAERNQLDVLVSEIQIKSLLEEIALDFKPLLDNKSLNISVSAPAINVWFDKDKMIRVFNNLLSNAIKYTQEGGQIQIVCEEIEGNIKIKFIDNGIGISESQQKKIFSRFVRASNALESNITGSGIGLVLAKKIVSLHHGDIEVESKLNEGSTFTVILKEGNLHFSREQIKVEEEIEELLPKLNLGTEQLVLLVEDNEDIRATVKAELEKSYEVIEAPNGKEGLVMALDKMPDLIITDVMMPIMSGKELCHSLKSNYKTSHIPVIMLTALSGIEDKIEGLELGADAYVEKPFRMDMLKITISNLLKSRKLIQKLMEEGKKEEVKAEAPSVEQDFLSTVVEIIKTNISNHEFTIDGLCEEMGYSRSNLFRKLKKLSGMSPSDLITKIRLNHAIELFKTRKDLRIADIAYESGFNDPKHFSSRFKKYYGKTPKQFMESV